MSFRINKIEIPNNLVLAPMAGITNEAYRRLCKRMGAGLVVAEMVSDKGLLYDNEKTKKMIEVAESDHPIMMQLFGSSYETLTEAAKLVIQESNVDIIDINMGCPVTKVIKKGAGSALLREPQKIYDIVKSLKDNVSLPITIKIRAGWDHEHINCDEVAKLATKAGVDAITIHGRTRSQMYRGSSSLEYIKMVKDATSVPVIGNGDIKDIESAVEMKKIGVDALMIGRAALGKPWIFRDLDRYFKGLDPLSEPTPEEIIAIILEHAKDLIGLKGERIAMIEMRGHLGWYFKHLRNSKKFRPSLVSVKNFSELKTICFEYLKSINVQD